MCHNFFRKWYPYARTWGRGSKLKTYVHVQGERGSTITKFERTCSMDDRFPFVHILHFLSYFGSWSWFQIYFNSLFKCGLFCHNFCLAASIRHILSSNPFSCFIPYLLSLKMFLLISLVLELFSFSTLWQIPN